MEMRLISIGFGNLVSVSRLIAVITPESAPVKRMISEARQRGMLLDATFGRKTRAVLVMDSDHIILSALNPETLANRMNQKDNRVKEFDRDDNLQSEES